MTISNFITTTLIKSVYAKVEEGAGGVDTSPAVLSAPSEWLSGFNPGILLPHGDLNYITGNIVPFVVNILLFLVLVLSLIFLIIGGIMWITSRGEKEGLAKAKATVTYALIGLALGLGSWIILNLIGQLFGINFFTP